MKNPVPSLLFIAIAAAGFFFAGGIRMLDNPASMVVFVASLFLASLVANSIRVINQWEKALVFRLGEFKGLKGPGLFTILPGFDQIKVVDTRIITLEIPTQQAITKDNVPLSLDGVIFLRVTSPADAVIRVQNYQHAIRQYAQTALRDVIGAVTLDEILADREGVGKKIEEMVDAEIVGWGLDVAAIRIQDLILPEDLKRVLARQASAEREKRANITKSEGDRLAAQNLADAARTMAESPGALQLRTLQTLDSLGSSPSNTVVLAVPIDMAHGAAGTMAANAGLTLALQKEGGAKPPALPPSAVPIPTTAPIEAPPVTSLELPSSGSDIVN